jgi:DNA-directed RNA polymerase specialized sigma24 family protein
MSTRDAFVQLATSAGAIAANLVDDPTAVDDVVQEALVEALSKLPRLRQPLAFRAGSLQESAGMPSATGAVTTRPCRP